MNPIDALYAEARRLGVPLPSEAAAELSLALRAHIAQAIADAGGAISFARFMELALYAPGLGYYSAGSTKLGAAGDFVTAPEISPLFSRALARQCASILSTIGGDILEFGAGRGVMAADILQELQRQNALPERYLILEVSADLRQRQHALLAERVPDLLARVQWLGGLPERFVGVMLGNEVVDALPVEIFRIENGALREAAVSLGAGGFTLQSRAPSPALAEWYQALCEELPEPLSEGYQSEANLVQGPWLAEALARLDQGVMLLIDYGFARREYYVADRNDGTLMCHYRHHTHADPLLLLGLQDITAHVDFTALAERALAEQADVLGFTSQGHFLTACGILELAEAMSVDTRSQLEVAAQLKRLLMPYEMGELFKLLALGKGFDEPLLGFAMNDRRRSL